MATKTYLGIGLYTLSDATQIVGVKPSKLRSWIKQYTYKLHGQTYYHTPVIRRYFEGESEPLTFLELVELLFVKLFREQGVSMYTIRRAARIAVDLFQTDYPFAVKRFDTDGKRIFATLTAAAASERFVEELGRGQIVFEQFVRPFFRKLDYRGEDEALRYWPLGHDRRVVLDPKRQFGVPIDADTGVPTQALFDALIATGTDDVQEVARWFNVPTQAIWDAAEFESSMRRVA